MASDLYEELLDYVKDRFGNDFLFDTLNGNTPHRSNDLMGFVKSLKKHSLTFSLHKAKEFRQKGNYNKAMLIVSELVRDHITSLRHIQRIFDEIHGNEKRKVVFKKFRQCEPFEVGLSNAPDVIRIIDEFIVPWKKKLQIG